MGSIYRVGAVLAVEASAAASAAATVGAVMRPSVNWSTRARTSSPCLDGSAYPTASADLRAVVVEHNRNACGYPIWFDLLVVIAVAGRAGLSATFAHCRCLGTRHNR